MTEPLGAICSGDSEQMAEAVRQEAFLFADHVQREGRLGRSGAYGGSWDELCVNSLRRLLTMAREDDPDD